MIFGYPVGYAYREKEGPGKGWWGPPHGTHTPEIVEMSRGTALTPEGFARKAGLWDKQIDDWKLSKKQKIKMDEDEGEAWVSHARPGGKLSYYVHVKLKVPQTIDGEPTGRTVDWHARGKVGGNWKVLT